MEKSFPKLSLNFLLYPLLYPKKMPSKKFGQSSTPKSTPKSIPKTAGARSGASKWLGPLAGLAAGGLLAAMIFGDGFEGIQMFDILLIALAGFMLFKLFGRKRSLNSQYAEHQSPYEDGFNTQDYQAREAVQQTSSSINSGSIIGTAITENAQAVHSLPAWFDEQNFIDNAKQHFISVQKAWDAADIQEIKNYCSPELFDALSAEMAGVQAGDNHTQVDELDVEMLEAVIDSDYLVVSIRFTGYIVEEQGADAHAFNEIWHIRRLSIGEGDWQISGIQQN